MSVTEPRKEDEDTMPKFFTVNDRPVKIVERPDGDTDADRSRIRGRGSRDQKAPRNGVEEKSNAAL